MTTTTKRKATRKSNAAKATPKVSPQDKYVAVRSALNKALIERHDEIDMVLTGLISNNHPLLVGPPGTGKSFLIDSLMAWIAGNSKKYNILLGKFSQVEEVFGPLNLPKLKQGIYSRVTSGKLPEADFAFIDEIFKASSAILNSMLKVLNERKFDKGDGTEVDVPLRIALAASNEWPEAEELGALFDRFLLRKTVKYVTPQGRKRLLRSRSHKPQFEHTITTEELDRAHEEAMDLEFTEAAWNAFDQILDDLANEGIHPGDRRCLKATDICRAFAYLRGGSQVEVEHLEVLKWVLWDDATEQELKCHKIVSKVANPIGSQITDLLMQANSVSNSTKPEEAVVKLQEIQKSLKALKSHPRKDAAIKYVTKQISRTYNTVIGVDPDEDLGDLH